MYTEYSYAELSNDLKHEQTIKVLLMKVFRLNAPIETRERNASIDIVCKICDVHFES